MYGYDFRQLHNATRLKHLNRLKKIIGFLSIIDHVHLSSEQTCQITPCTLQKKLIGHMCMEMSKKRYFIKGEHPKKRNYLLQFLQMPIYIIFMSQTLQSQNYF